MQNWLLARLMGTGAALLGVILYLAGAFIYASWDVADWDFVFRFCVAAVWLLCLAVLASSASVLK